MSEVKLPATLPGHWDSTAGHAMAAEYAGKSRNELAMPSLSDFALANAQFLVSRHDLELVAYQAAAKERIRWLSVQLASAVQARSINTAMDTADRLARRMGGRFVPRQPTPAADEVDVELDPLVIAGIDNSSPAELKADVARLMKRVKQLETAMQARPAEPAGEEPVEALQALMDCLTFAGGFPAVEAKAGDQLDAAYRKAEAALSAAQNKGAGK